MRSAPFIVIISAGVLSLAGCDMAGPGPGTVRVGGSAAVGVSTGDGYVAVYRGHGGPPPGRTQAERDARRDYYRGPRGHEF